MNKQSDKISIRPVIRALDVGKTAEFPIKNIESVRSIAYLFGVKYGMKFKTESLRLDNIIRVTRVE